MYDVTFTATELLLYVHLLRVPRIHALPTYAQRGLAFDGVIHKGVFTRQLMFVFYYTFQHRMTPSDTERINPIVLEGVVRHENQLPCK